MRPHPLIRRKFAVMRIVRAAAVLLAFGMPLAATAAEPAKASKPVAGKPVATAVKSAAETHHAALIAAAGRGDGDAQYQLGLAYRDGHGMKADAAAALGWFGLAGINGNVAGAIEAAKAFEAGRGARRDITQAGRWWYRAAQLGDAAARERWLALFLDGKLPSIGGAAGIGWLAERAGHGDVRSVMALAEAYEKGQGIAPNPTEAEAWYRLAAQIHADTEARFRLGRLLRAQSAAWRVPETEDWNPKESERRGRPFGAVWLTAKPADAEDKAAQMRPGLLEGEYWLEAAAHEGHAEAQYVLGQAMTGGVDLPLDMVGGIGWLEAAAAQNHAEAMMALADFVAKGQGVPGKDPVRAYVLYDLAAQQGEDGAGAAREAVAKTLNQKQAARARQLVQDLRDLN